MIQRNYVMIRPAYISGIRGKLSDRFIVTHENLSDKIIPPTCRIIFSENLLGTGTAGNVLF
jgi:hypothetical protein